MMFKRVLPFLFAVVAFGLPDAAYAKHDYEFAMALAQRRRYYDLAEMEFKKLMKSSDPKLAMRGQFGLAKIKVFQATREHDPVKRTALYDEALTQMSSLVGRSPFVEGRFDLGELYKQKANYLILRAEKESDKAETLKGEARTAFGEAIKQFDKVAKKLKGSKDNDLAFMYRKATYLVIESKFEKAITWPLADSKRDSILSGLKTSIEEFCWDNESFIAAFFAYSILGQVHASLVTKKHPTAADLEDSFAAFDAALNIQQMPETVRVRTTAYYNYLKICNRFKVYDKALKLTKLMRKDYAGIESLYFGQAAVIEEAKMYFGKGDFAKAMALAQKIAAKGGYWANKSKLLLGKWRSITGGTTGAKESFLVAQGFFNQRNWWSAARAYQDTIKALDAKPDPALAKAHLVKSWDQLAICFKQLGLGYEAYHALFEASKAAESMGNMQKAAEEAYYAFRAIKRRSYASKSKADDELANKARAYFLKKFPESPYRTGIQLQRARDREEKGDFMGAITDYQGIGKTTEFYEEALSRIGICWYREMRKRMKANKENINSAVREAARKADVGFSEYLDYIKKNKTTDPTAKEKREELLGRVVYYQGSTCEKLGKLDDVLKVLEGFEKKYATKVTPELLGAGVWLRLKSRILQAEAFAKKGDQINELKRLEEAERELDAVKEAAPNSRYETFGLAKVGFGFDQLANRYRQAKDESNARRFEVRAVKFLYPWALRYQGIKFIHLDYLGKKCFMLGRDGELTYTKQATRMFALALSKFPKEAEKNKHKPYLADCYFQTEQWAKAISLLRAEYAVKPRSLFAIKSLGRCYYELGIRRSTSRDKYRKLILDSRQEDMALLPHLGKSPSLTRDVVHRASVLYGEVLKLTNPKARFLDSDYDKFQKSMLKMSKAEKGSTYKRLVDQYYARLVKKLDKTSSGNDVKYDMAWFSLDRALFYYRSVAGKVEKLKETWWDAKYYVIRVFAEQGVVLHDRSDSMEEGGDKKVVYREGSKLLKHAMALYRNFATLYPNMGGEGMKAKFGVLRDYIKEKLGQ